MKGAQGQLDLALQNTSAPPRGVRGLQVVVDRAHCPTVRPCDRYSCPHHLWVEDERPGRPHHGVSPPPKLKARAESCALDVSDGGDSTAEQVAAHLGVTAERVNQLEDRALAKVSAASAVEAYLEDLHPRLPEGVRLDVVYPEQIDAHRVVIALVLSVDGKRWRRAQQQAGVFVRRKR
jgi:hypothetical protein